VTADSAPQVPARQVIAHSEFSWQACPSLFLQAPPKHVTSPLQWSSGFGSGTGFGDPRPPMQVWSSSASSHLGHQLGRHLFVVQAASKHSQAWLAHWPGAWQSSPVARLGMHALAEQ
jgi:hypothetical protein